MLNKLLQKTSRLKTRLIHLGVILSPSIVQNNKLHQIYADFKEMAEVLEFKKREATLFEYARYVFLIATVTFYNIKNMNDFYKAFIDVDKYMNHYFDN